MQIVHFKFHHYRVIRHKSFFSSLKKINVPKLEFERKKTCTVIIDFSKYDLCRLNPIINQPNLLFNPLFHYMFPSVAKTQTGNFTPEIGTLADVDTSDSFKISITRNTGYCCLP